MHGSAKNGVEASYEGDRWTGGRKFGGGGKNKEKGEGERKKGEEKGGIRGRVGKEKKRRRRGERRDFIELEEGYVLL